MKFKNFFSIVLLVFIISLTACTSYNEENSSSNKDNKPTEETKILELNGVEKAKINLDFPVGILNINGNEEKLMKWKYIYSKKEWKSEVKYEVKDKQGNISISQHLSKSDKDNTRNEWNIDLNDKIPMDIKLGLGAGDFKANLSNVNLKELYVHMGVGRVNLDISGAYKNNIKVNIQGGVGEATVYLPKSIGSRIKVQKGVGAVSVNGFIQEEGDIYKNSQYGKTKNNIEVNIETGVGSIKVKQK